MPSDDHHHHLYSSSMSIDQPATGSSTSTDPIVGKGLHLFNYRHEKSNETQLKSNNTTTQPMHEVKRLENSTVHNTNTSSSTISSSLELLNSYGKRFRKFNTIQSSSPINPPPHRCEEATTEHEYRMRRKKMSTEEVMRVAGERYIQFSDHPSCDDFTMLMHPFGYALSSSLSEGEMRDVELAHLLLAAAEKVGCHQYERASRLLTRCEWIASDRSNAVQRVVHCFAEALRERIDRGLGKLMVFTIPEAVYGGGSSWSTTGSGSILNGLGVNMASICLHQQVPFSQVLQLTTVQAIVENIGSARKLHCIDLEIRSGVIWTALMQALANREHNVVEHLRVTAVARISDRFDIDDTGKRLQSFARSINFPFTFHVVYVAESLSDVREDAFRIYFDESVVVFCSLVLRTLLGRPQRLENLMRVIRNLNPTLMVVSEAEANHNSPVFVNRFIEALFYYSAYFDSLETCMADHVDHRAMIEATLSHGLRNIVAMEGNERTSRNVKLEVWRAFFSRFRIAELGFSESSIYQAGLVIKQFPQWSSCTVEKDGKGLVVGWKGTPLFSLSAWKFPRDRGLGRFFNHRFC